MSIKLSAKTINRRICPRQPAVLLLQNVEGVRFSTEINSKENEKPGEISPGIVFYIIMSSEETTITTVMITVSD